MADITVSLDEQYITVTEVQPISFTIDGALTGATGPQGIQGVQGPQGEPGQNGQDAEWGLITGTLSDQTDLQSALDNKADISSLSDVATSNNYNDLDNKPTIPTSLSGLSGTSDDITEGSANLFMTDGERTKLSGIESGADVTDPGNVASAGAVMTSGNQSIGGKKTFDEEITSLVRAIAPSFTMTSVWGSLVTNAYYDSGWKYLDDGVAGLIESDGTNGGFNFYYASAGDLGGPITWNQVLTLNSDGINALAHQIKNVADPTDSQDATTKAWVEDYVAENGGSGGGSNWGDIGGMLSDQIDLQSALNAKANTSSLSTVATSGSYNDLSSKPTIPTSLSGLSGTSDDITQGSTKLLLTSAERTKLNNTSGTNTGDQTLSGLGGVPTSRTINGLDLTADRTLNQDNIGDGTTYKQYSATEKTKLSGIESGAEVTTSAKVSTAGGLIIVNHGATAGTARPSVSGAVIWVGSVDPTNAVNGDIYLQQ